MTAYLYPNLKSKKAYKELISTGGLVTALENRPSGQQTVNTGVVTFEGPHYPRPHKFYGEATVVKGRVVSIK